VKREVERKGGERRGAVRAWKFFRNISPWYNIFNGPDDGVCVYVCDLIDVVGYGHIAPKTAAGMVVTIFYAIVGIPLTLLTITNLGRMLATAFRFLYRNIFSILCSCCSRPPQPETLPLNATTSGISRFGDFYFILTN